MGLRPTQGDEKQLLSSNDSPWKRALPLVIPTGVKRSGGTCGFLLLPPKHLVE
jgi:hypothetical protein